MIFKWLEKNTYLTRETQDYINRYQVTYKRIIKGAKEREKMGMFEGQKIKQKQCGK